MAWLLDLDHIRLDADKPLNIQWTAPWARWSILAFALAVVVLVTLTYRRESGSRAIRIASAVLRASALAIVLAMICRPVLVLQQNRIERAAVHVLIDTSASMKQTDGAGADYPPSQKLRRLAAGVQALTADDNAAISTLLRSNDVVISTFAGREEPLRKLTAADPTTDLAPALDALTADGAATNLLAAIRHTLSDSSSRVAAIVVVTDGQSTEGVDAAEVIDLARRRRVPIMAICVGSSTQRVDLSVGPLIADRSVFAGDIVTARSELVATGLQEQEEITARLMDERTGDVLATTQVGLGPDTLRAVIELAAGPFQPGRVPLRMEITPAANEEQREDNVSRCEIDVRDDDLRVLFVDGYPRYEYRYLKNALLREHSIALSCLLLNADEDFAQEGLTPIRRFPETPDELAEFDVIILGDVDPRRDWMTDAQARMLVDFVGQRGGGLAVIAGERHAPASFRGTPLEALVPVELDTGTPAGGISMEFHPRLTHVGRLSRIFRFERSESRSARLFESLPPLFWRCSTRGPRPGAEVLLEDPDQRTDGAALPVVVTSHYGAGRTFFQGTDDTWRWRRHTGELVYDSYWVRVVRALAPVRGPGVDDRADIRLERTICRCGERIGVQLEVHDLQLLAALGTTTTLTMTDADDFGVQHVKLEALGGGTGLFEGSVTPGRVGSFTIRAESITPVPGRWPVTADLHVEHAGIETVRPEANHALLQRLAEGTGGSVVALDAPSESLARIEDRSLQIPDDVSEPLWDSKLFVMLIAGLLTFEWVLRKLAGMM